MSRFKRILTVITVLVLLGFCIFTYSILSQRFYLTDHETNEEISSMNLTGKIGYYRYGSDSLRYVWIDKHNDDLPILLALHGAPGSSSDYLSYWSSELLLNHFNMITIDRPGYGFASSFNTDVPIEEQAQIIYAFLNEFVPDKKLVILSHSYGGPVGAVLSSLLDSSCLGHVMVAPVIDPQSEELFWYSSIPLLWPFREISSNDWKLAALEKQSHIDQLEQLKNEWRSIEHPTIHIHGTEDWLASFENVKFCKNYFNNTQYTDMAIDGGSHFILWDDKVKSLIISKSIDLLMCK